MPHRPTIRAHVIFAGFFGAVIAGASAVLTSIIPHLPWVQAMLILVLGAASPFLCRWMPRDAADSGPLAAPAVGWPVWGAVLFVVVVTAYWHGVWTDQMRALPIHPSTDDRLPLLLQGFADLDALRSPYRPHYVPWPLYNYYLPTTMLPYYVAYKLGLDVRWVTVICFDAIALVSGGLAIRRTSGDQLPLGLAVWFAVFTSLAFFVGVHSLVSTAQLGPFWLYTTLAFVLVSVRSRWAFLAFSLALGSREDAVAYSLIPVIAALRHAALGGAAFAARIVIGAALIFLPVVLVDPLFYLGNIRQYSSLSWVITEGGGPQQIGLSGLLHRVGLLSLQPVLWIGSVSALVPLYLMRERQFRLSAMFAYCASASMLYAVLAPISWIYLFVTPLILLAMWVVHDTTARLPRRSLAVTVICVAMGSLFTGITQTAVRPKAPVLAVPAMDDCQRAAFESAVERVSALREALKDAPEALDAAVRALLLQARTRYESCSR